MSAPPSRNAAISAKCRECAYDEIAPGTWRQQVAACPATSCPLWRFRPLPNPAPAWLASRDVADLPEGWSTLSHEQALAALKTGTIGSDLSAKGGQISPSQPRRVSKCPSNGEAAKTTGFMPIPERQPERRCNL